MEEDLVRLVKATVKAEVDNQMRTRASEFIGRGGDTTIASDGNIWLQSGVNKKAYYKGVEIGGSVSGTTNKIAKFTSASAIGNSNLSDNGTGLLFNFASYAGTGAYIKNDVNGTIELHVPSGQAIKIIVG
jgi:hypothetical protein